MDEEDTAAAAQAWNVDPDAYATWEEVELAVLAAQEGAALPPPSATSAGYTRQELEAVAAQPDGAEQLKEICAYNHIPLPGVRPRRSALVQLILDVQAGRNPQGQNDQRGRPQTASGAPRAAPGPTYHSELQAALLDQLRALTAAIRDLVNAQRADAERIIAAVEAHTASLVEAIDRTDRHRRPPSRQA